MISAASASLMAVPLRASAKSTSQRMASDNLAVRRHFHRHLIGRAADAAGLDFQARLGVIHRPLQNFQRIGRRILGRDLIERAIDNPLRRGLLAADHDRVDQARHQRAVVFAVFQQRSFDCLTTSGHKI